MLSELLPRERVRGFASKTPVSYPSGTLWPHGEWSLGWGKRRPDGGEWHEDPYVGMGVVDTPAAKAEARRALALDLSDVPNSHTPVRRGAKGITGHGQQMVKAAGHLMQEYWPHHRKTLGTITLPSMSQETRREVVEAWPEITRQLLQWQTRRLKRLGVPEAIVSVCEIQPKRFAESGEAVLHLHQLWLNVPAKCGRYSFSPNLIRSYVSRLLMRLCPSYTWGFINVDVKPVEGVVAAYLAKYMSKGKQMLAEAMEDWGEGNHPRTWWNMNKPTRDMVKAATYRGEAVGERLESAVYSGWNIGPDRLFAFIRQIDMEYDGRSFTVGWRGRFLPDVDKRFRQGLKSLDIERLGSN
jgi:hypothetical protein